MRNSIILIISFLLIITAVEAKEIEGKVSGYQLDIADPLPGAKVWFVGTKSGTFTDKKGNFKIRVPKGARLLAASYVGFSADTIDISKKNSPFNFMLKSKSTETDEVVITESQPGQISESGIQQSERITLKGLRKAACCNLAESFETNPSVDVSYSDAVTGARQIQLLGLNQVYSQVMTEKLPNLRGVATPFGLNYIPGSWMESIQISKGASSVQDGFESVTGQINVEYKKPFDSELFFLNLYGNNMGRMEGNLNSSYVFEGEELGTTIFAHGSMNQIEIDNNGDGFLDIPMLKQLNLMNRWRYAGENLKGNLGARVLIEDREAGQKGFFSDGEVSNDLYGINVSTKRYELFGKNGYIFPTVDYHSIAVIYKMNFHDQEAFYGNKNYNAEQLSGYINAIYSTMFFDKNEHHEDHEEGEIEPEPDHKLNIGLNYQYDQFNEATNDTSFIRTEMIPGIYGEYTFTGEDWLTLSAGLRADFHNLFGTFITPRFHSRIKLNDMFTVRASAGKGWRSVNLFAENQGLFASSRELIVTERIKPEEAWNYGLNFTSNINIFDEILTVNVEFYRTDFVNQMIVDMDRDPLATYFYNLDGKSYSNSFQIDAQYEFFRGFEAFAAYRLNDIRMTIDDKLRQKPLISRHKGFLNLGYATLFDEWQFDWTIVYNGSGRFPNTDNSPEEFRLGNRYDPFFTMNAQITKKLGDFQIYLGAENLTNYRQPNPIINPDNPFNDYFDTNYVYGPIVGRMIYAGVRYELY